VSRLKNGSLPSYRHHRARNCGVVTIDGKDYYLGRYGTPASKQKYAALIRAWQERQQQAIPPTEEPLRPTERPTINELILAYLKHASAYYKLHHGENKEAGCIDDALKVLQECGYGGEPADAFRPRDLKTTRDAMIAKGWSRSYVNAQINRLKRMFRHAVEEDLIPGTVYHALTAVKGLRRGTRGVKERPKVRPIPVNHIKAVLKKAHAMLRAMIRLAYHTGARPGEICALKPGLLDRTKAVWEYRVPADSNKTEHHGYDRTVFIGPRGQKVLAPWLQGLADDDFVFSPIRAEALRQAQRRAQRKNPLWPSHLAQQARKRSANPARKKRDHYDPTSFRRAVKRLCLKAGIPAWTPNRLRHNAATRFRKRCGLETARILLGHRRMNTTEIYAEADTAEAREKALALA
jgi:integrase